MIAKVLPLKRLPRHLGAFDYVVPNEMQSQAAIGQLVTIPFRKSMIHGLVLNLSDNAPISNLKPMDRIINEVPLFASEQLDLFSTIATLYHTSPATIAKMSVLPLQKRKLKQMNLEKIKRQGKKRATKPLFLQYTSQQERRHVLEKSISGNTLILVPEVKQVQYLEQLVTHRTVLTWHSELTQKEQFDAWLDIRNAKDAVIISTRSGVFLPMHHIDTIIIDLEHEGNHKHWDQLPRFHDKDIVELTSHTFGSKVIYMSYSPSLEAYYHVHKQHYDQQSALTLMPKNDRIDIIKMDDERKAGNYDVFGDRIKTILKESSEDVFVYINRKGYATSVGCRDCSYTATCDVSGLPYVYHEETRRLHCHYSGESIPMLTSCPQCDAPVLAYRGAGTEQVTEFVRSLCPDAHVVRIDADVDNTLPTKRAGPRFIVGTQYAFSKIDWQSLRAIVYVDLDRQLNIPEYLSHEYIWHTIQSFLYHTTDTCRIYLQTRDFEHLLIRSLREPDRFYRMTLSGRKTLGYPPYTYLVRYFYGNQAEHLAKREADRQYHRFADQLTKHHISAKISDPMQMQPKYYRGKYWYAILVKITEKEWHQTVRTLNQSCPSGWKVDPRPISILSP